MDGQVLWTTNFFLFFPFIKKNWSKYQIYCCCCFAPETGMCDMSTIYTTCKSKSKADVFSLFPFNIFFSYSQQQQQSWWMINKHQNQWSVVWLGPILKNYFKKIFIWQARSIDCCFFLFFFCHYYSLLVVSEMFSRKTIRNETKYYFYFLERSKVTVLDFFLNTSFYYYHYYYYNY